MHTGTTTHRLGPDLLRQAIRDSIIDQIPKEVDVLLLYGSRARGDADEDSDWDVLVMLHDHADLPTIRRQLREITGKLAERYNEQVQFVALRWKDADEAVGLLENAAREGVRL